jgi:hypothetical protein
MVIGVHVESGAPLAEAEGNVRAEADWPIARNKKIAWSRARL